jgi:hypothetical protein
MFLPQEPERKKKPLQNSKERSSDRFTQPDDGIELSIEGEDGDIEQEEE